MQPKLLEIQKLESLSFTISKYNCVKFKTTWHYHKEIEITLIQKGKGTRFVGDSIQKFEDGDMVILGTNTPHVWKSQESSSTKNSLNFNSKAIVIHFSKEMIGKELFKNPEMQHINRFLEESKRGIVFNKKQHSFISNEINKIISLEPFAQFISLLKILDLMTKIKQYEYLSSERFNIGTNNTKNNKLDKVIKYIMENFQEEILLSQVAEIANLSKTSFCRSFKFQTGTNFTNFVNQIRIRYAASLLLEKDCNITEACFESGFNNLSYFNRVFKRIINHSPTKYKNNFHKFIDNK